MAHWNHRVVKRMVRDFGADVESLGIHECFYDGDDIGWTDEPIAVRGETLDDLRETLERMLACLNKPVIDATN